MTDEPRDMRAWLDALAVGDDSALQSLWDDYFQRLSTYSRRRLDGMPRRAADEEDVAASALYSFCDGVSAGRFAGLADSGELWKLLLVIAARKATALRRRHMSQKRGGGQVRGESVFGSDSDSLHGSLQAAAADGGPSPELTQMMLESCRERLDVLGDETLRRIAVWKLEGYGNQEIAVHLHCTVRTVERKLERIRAIWTLADDSASGAEG